jgi:hypothetical protein
MRNALGIASILAFITEGFGQILPVAPIAGQPFSADEVITENPRPNVHNVLPKKTIRIYRDSAGRTREDVSIPRDPIAMRFVNIQDPLAGVHYSLDTERKIARRLVWPATRGLTPTTSASDASAVSVMAMPRAYDVQTKRESLGNQLIEGLAADGQRTTSVSPGSPPGCDENVAVSESWYSRELRMILLEKRSNCLGDGTTRLEHIDRTDQGWSGPPPQ